MSRYQQIITLFLSLVLVMTASCAKEVVQDRDSSEKKLVEAYMMRNYPDKIGSYVLDLKEGTGADIHNKATVLADYNIKDLYGNYLYTTNRELAKKLGFYSNAIHYEPGIFQLGASKVIVGMENFLISSKIGTKAAILIPSWLSGYSEETDNRTFSQPVIYELDIKDAISDYKKHEISLLENFSKKYCGGIDSLSKGYYRYIQKEGKDTVTYGTSLSIRYVAKLMDGFVFDTNIADTAKQYRIYDSMRQYDPLRVVKKDASTVTVSDNNLNSGVSANPNSKIPKGLSKGLSSMKHGEKAIIFFSSDWGFPSNSKKNFQIAQPLIYYVEVLSKED